MNWLWHSLYEAAAMFWEVLWALVLGFMLSGVMQAFVSKQQMTRAFGRAGLHEVALATAFGAASSSCSYAAVAAARTAFKKGAALVPALAFMFASTNLVFELGLVLWLLMGWPFVLAELVGSFVLIGVMWLLVRLTLPQGLVEEARSHTEEETTMCHSHDSSEASVEEQPLLGKMKQLENWRRVADAFVMDWSMLWKELIIGFVIAGLLAVLIPQHWWQALFLNRGTGALRLLENAVVGPLIAVASFVCSVGNIPLASLLWSSGISFGGVISFIYADLIVVPLIVVYKKYYGTKMAVYITLVMYVSMVVAGISVDLLFTALHLIPTGARPPSAATMASFQWNYSTYLNFVAIAVAAFLILIHVKNRRAGSDESHDHAFAPT
jgi:hypothetical protein